MENNTFKIQSKWQELLAVSKSLLYEKVGKNLIPFKKLGRRILIPASFVEKFTA